MARIESQQLNPVPYRGIVLQRKFNADDRLPRKVGRHRMVGNFLPGQNTCHDYTAGRDTSTTTNGVIVSHTGVEERHSGQSLMTANSHTNEDGQRQHVQSDRLTRT